VLAESFERIHRSNLIGMGVLPLQYADGESAETLALTGHEVFSVTGLESLNDGVSPKTVRVTAAIDDRVSEFEVRLRIDTPMEAQYFRHGGILPYMLRQMAG
jgi:aconitate hydratase